MIASDRKTAMAKRDKRAFARGVNERIAVIAETLGPQTRFQFVCECLDEHCIEDVAMTSDEWEAATARPECSVVHPDHVAVGEKAVVVTGDYAIVRRAQG